MSDANKDDVVDLTQPKATKEEKVKREMKFRSQVWQHFTMKPENPEECKCNYCKRFFFFLCQRRDNPLTSSHKQEVMYSLQGKDLGQVTNSIKLFKR